MARKCNLCGSERAVLFERDMYSIGRDKFDLVKCSLCGLIFVDPLPDSRQRKEMYSKDYFDTNKMSGMRGKGYMEDADFYEKEFSRMMKKILKYNKGSRFMDVGCAAGYLLNLARESGYDVQGVEISKWAGDFAKKRFGLKVFNGELADAGFESESFDVVTALNVLEHVENPSMFLAEAGRILKKGGLLVVDVPAYVNSPYFAVAKRISGFFRDDGGVQKMFKTDKDKMPYHLYEFSFRNLKQMAESFGFSFLSSESDVPCPEVVSRGRGIKFRMLQANFLFLNFLARVFNLNFTHMVLYFIK